MSGPWPVFLGPADSGGQCCVFGGQICLPPPPPICFLWVPGGWPLGAGSLGQPWSLASGWVWAMRPAPGRLAGAVERQGNQFPRLGCSSEAGAACSLLFCEQPPLLPLQPRAWEQLAPVARPRALPYPLWFLPSAHTSVNSPFAKLFPINPLVERGSDSLRQQEWWCPGQSRSHLTNHRQDILSSPPPPAGST